MKRYAKIPAFTLTELMVVLALSTVVIGIGYTVMGLIGRNIIAIENNYSNSTQIELLEQQMTVDFHRYRTITFDPLENTLKMKTPIDSITYTFSEKTLLRQTDTVLSQPIIPKYFWQGTEVTKGNIDALKLEWGPEEKKTYLFLYQEIDATRYITVNGN